MKCVFWSKIESTNMTPSEWWHIFTLFGSGFGASGGGGEGGIVNSWRIKHPVVTFFHLLFRTLAIIGNQPPIHLLQSLRLINILLLAYLLCGWFSEGFIGSFVAIILLLSLDFWTVKNITGRIMAGLRWAGVSGQTSKTGWSQVVELCEWRGFKCVGVWEGRRRGGHEAQQGGGADILDRPCGQPCHLGEFSLEGHKSVSRQANLIQHLIFRHFCFSPPSSNWSSVGWCL